MSATADMLPLGVKPIDPNDPPYEAKRALVVAAPSSPDAVVGALTERLRHGGLAVERVTRAQVARHPWGKRRSGLVVATTGDPAEAAIAAADADLPLVLPGGEGDPCSNGPDELRLVSHTVLAVHLDHRPLRLALGECLVSSDDPAVLCRLDVDRGTFAARVPLVRVATADPLQLLQERRCRHTGAATMVGLCWSLDQPDADRMIRRRSQVEVTRPDCDQLRVTCDGGRFAGLARHIRIGPNRRFRLAYLSP